MVTDYQPCPEQWPGHPARSGCGREGHFGLGEGEIGGVLVEDGELGGAGFGIFKIIVGLDWINARFEAYKCTFIGSRYTFCLSRETF